LFINVHNEYIQKHGTSIQKNGAQREVSKKLRASHPFPGPTCATDNRRRERKLRIFSPHFSNHKNHQNRFLPSSAASSTITMVNRIATHINAHSSSPSKVTTANSIIPSSPKRLLVDELKHPPHSPSASVASSSGDSSKLASDDLVHPPEKTPRAVVSPDHDVNKLPIEELMLTTVHKSDHKLAEEAGEFADEPLLKESKHRFVLFPIQDNDVRTI
jgi:hypothetical protein